MNRIKIIIEQTMMVSFMVLCYVSIYGLLAMKKYDYTFDWDIPGSIVLASFMCSVVTVFFLYDFDEKNEQSKVRGWVSLILHFVLLYFVIMGFGYLCHWYRGTSGFIVTSVIYVIIYFGAWAGTTLIFRHDSKIISEALDKVRDED